MTTPRNAIRTWALVATIVSSIFVMAMIVWLTFLLASKDSCNAALGAQRVATDEGKIAGADACFTLLRDQMGAMAFNSHMLVGTLALCLLVLVVIILAGGKLSFNASKDGISAEIERDEAVQHVASEAQDAADEIKGG